jgi:hypothetical protein
MIFAQLQETYTPRNFRPKSWKSVHTFEAQIRSNIFLISIYFKELILDKYLSKKIITQSWVIQYPTYL